MRFVVFALLAAEVLGGTALFSQSSSEQTNQSFKSSASSALPTNQGRFVLRKVNELAELSRAGDMGATRELAHQAFQNNGIPAQMADAFGLTDRVIQAEAAYTTGRHSAIREDDIVNAVNDFATALQAPIWVHTNAAEVRRLRMSLLVAYPGLIAAQEPPDGNGHYKAVSENMRPTEAVYIALSLLYQKHYSASFQFTDEEKLENAKLETATVKAKHFERTQIFDGFIRGQSTQVSMRDLLDAANLLFNDLRIDQVAKSDAVDSPAVAGQSGKKGERK